MRFAASPIGIWGDITPKSEKIAEKCTIFFERPIKCNAYITEQIINKERGLSEEARAHA